MKKLITTWWSNKSNVKLVLAPALLTICNVFIFMPATIYLLWEYFRIQYRLIGYAEILRCSRSFVAVCFTFNRDGHIKKYFPKAMAGEFDFSRRAWPKEAGLLQIAA
jgi:hypothetical protein